MYVDECSKCLVREIMGVLEQLPSDAFDDKRYILDDGKTTLAYEHPHIAGESVVFLASCVNPDCLDFHGLSMENP